MELSATSPCIQILLVDPRAYERPALLCALRKNYEVLVAQTGEEAVQLIKEERPAAILLDADEKNREYLSLIEEYDKQTPLLLTGQHPDDEYAADGFRRSPLKMWLDHTIASRQLRAQVARLTVREAESQAFGGFVTRNPGVIAIFRVLKRVTNVDVPILITGESGTGKELIARGIHDASERKKQPFVALNCAAIPENLLETELFGYEKGAFTGATTTKIGKLEYAGRGTVFLDEIGDMPLAIQAKLLRVLQERTFERVGGHLPLDFRARIVAATNKNLPEAIQQRAFREDLFYRLNTVHIALPPLRERREDISLLIEHFLKQMNQRYQRKVAGLSPLALNILQTYDWPGNVRELLNCIHHAVLLCDDTRIELKDLPAALQPGSRTAILPDQVGKVPLNILIERSRQTLERQVITFALEKFNYHKARCATYLGLDRKTLYRKMKELGVSGEPTMQETVHQR